MDSPNNASIAELIKRRRYQILMHSYIYYELNESVIFNEKYDQWARELMELQAQYPQLSKQVELFDEFKDFSTLGCGAALPFYKFPNLDKNARRLIECKDEEHVNYSINI